MTAIAYDMFEQEFVIHVCLFIYLYLKICVTDKIPGKLKWPSNFLVLLS